MKQGRNKISWGGFLFYLKLGKKVEPRKSFAIYTSTSDVSIWCMYMYVYPTSALKTVQRRVMLQNQE